MDVLTEKNLQARRAGSRNTEKALISDFSSVVKTRVNITIITSGLRSDQKKPKIEFRYLSLNSLTVRFFISSLYSSNGTAPNLIIKVEMFIAGYTI